VELIYIRKIKFDFHAFMNVPNAHQMPYGNDGLDTPKKGSKAFPTKLISVFACSGLKLTPTIIDIKTPTAILNQSRRP
jgi:hypothetical protein